MRDFTYATILIVLFIGTVVSQRFYPHVLEGLLVLTRQGATILILVGVLGLYYHGYHATALVGAFFAVYVLKRLWTTWVRSDARRLHLEIGRDLDRFNPAKSIDLQFANGSAKFDPADILVKPWNPVMLVYPPSAETMRQMTGE